MTEMTYIIVVLLTCFQKLCTGVTCPENYVRYGSNQKCFRKTEQDYKRSDGETLCREEGGHLISILNEDDKNFLLKKLPTENVDFWLGLKKEGDEYKWDDNSIMSWENWCEGSLKKQCAIFSEKWDDKDCDKEYKVICQQEKAGNVMCPGNYTDYGNSNGYKTCIRILPSTYERDVGAGFCQKDGAHLIYAKSQLESEQLNGIIKELEEEYWIGLNDMENGNQFWEDGSAMNWENWKAGFPEKQNEECVTTDGEWMDLPCTETHKVLCQWAPMPGTETSRPRTVIEKSGKFETHERKDNETATTGISSQSPENISEYIPVTIYITSPFVRTTTSSSSSKETSRNLPTTSSTLNVFATTALGSSDIVSMRNNLATIVESKSPNSPHVPISNKTPQEDMSTNNVDMLTTSSSSSKETSGNLPTTSPLDVSATSTLDSFVVMSTTRRNTLAKVGESNTPGPSHVTIYNDTTQEDMLTNNETMTADRETTVVIRSYFDATSESTEVAFLTEMNPTNEDGGNVTPAKSHPTTPSTRSTILPMATSVTVTRTTAEYKKRIGKFVPSAHEAAGAVVMGTLVIIILSAILGCIVLSDLRVLKRHLRRMLSNLGLIKQDPNPDQLIHA